MYMPRYIMCPRTYFEFGDQYLWYLSAFKMITKASARGLIAGFYSIQMSLTSWQIPNHIIVHTNSSSRSSSTLRQASLKNKRKKRITYLLAWFVVAERTTSVGTAEQTAVVPLHQHSCWQPRLSHRLQRPSLQRLLPPQQQPVHHLALARGQQEAGLWVKQDALAFARYQATEQEAWHGWAHVYRCGMASARKERMKKALRDMSYPIKY